jgi:hypothetical protein
MRLNQLELEQIYREGRLDSSRRSCQLSNGCINIPHTHEVLPLGLGRWNDRGLFFSTFRMRLHESIRRVHAFGVDDVEGAISGRCSDKYVLG